MQSSDLLEPTEPQIIEEWYLRNALGRMYNNIAENDRRIGTKKTKQIILYILPIFVCFDDYFHNKLGDNVIKALNNSDMSEDVIILPSGVNRDVINKDVFMELEERKASLLTKLTDTDYTSYFESLSFESQLEEFLFLFIIYLYCWYLSEKLYGQRLPPIYLIQMDKELSLMEGCNFIVGLIALNTPQLYDKIRQNIPLDDMGRISEGKERLPAPTPAMMLHQRLENAGAYERLKQLDPRRATLLQTYLTTEMPVKELGMLPGVGLRSRGQTQTLLHSSMDIAFFALPQQERAEYDNNPANALKTRSAQQTQTKSERITEANKTRRRAIQEGTYTGKPIGRPRRNAQAQEANTTDQ
jgi:hypothetical protein